MSAVVQAEIFESASRTETVSSSVFDFTRDGDGITKILALLDVTVVTGTSPTLDVTIVGIFESGREVTLGSFTQATGVTAEDLTFEGPLPIQIRADATIGGTTPDFTFSLDMAVELV